MFDSNLEKGFKGMFASNRAKRIERLMDEVFLDERKAESPSAASQPGPDTVRHRAIRRAWPRDPKGPVIEGPYGTFKTAGNGLPLWGATVLDFFHTRRIADCPYLELTSTSSKLLAFVKAVGELNHAPDEIAWAEQEADPVEIMPDLDEGVLKSMPDNAAFHQFHNRIPFHLLPEKLVVHDPDNTVQVGTRDDDKKKKKLALPRFYKLCLSAATRKAIAAKREEIKNAPKKHSPGLMFITDPSLLPGSEPLEDGKVLEATFAQLPPYPDEPTFTRVAHLYLSADQRLGQGNHSYVYRAELEIPRSLVVEPTMCDECSSLAILKQLKAEMPHVKTNPEEPLGYQIEDLLLAAAKEHKRTGRIWTEHKVEPMEDFAFSNDRDDPSKDKHFSFSKPGTYSRDCYEGTRRKINVQGVQWSTPGNYCEHQPKRRAAPTTFKVEVAAKLSIQHDDHLKREASNYQNGYNVLRHFTIQPPYRPVVPQFYGYYVPEKTDEDKDTYISPILLVEDCGKAVDVDELGMDDRQECAALFFRMHAEGWLHNSVAPRNVVMDYGNIHDWPVLQSSLTSDVKRFRIIDFGRSVHEEDVNAFRNEQASESMTVQRLFQVANGPYL
ncbi:hypothetical protein BDZ89DRAFT_1057144 [Hymenopellis radicata]|nr:hypothetical protein BDZ89DRAFT_1057144 [Hymenopellis radicata]